MEILPMNFLEAVNLLKNGIFITRSTWDDYYYLIGSKGGIYKNMGTAEVSSVPWVPKIDDLLADDWQTVHIDVEKVNV